MRIEPVTAPARSNSLEVDRERVRLTALAAAMRHATRHPLPIGSGGSDYLAASLSFSSPK